MIQFIKKIFLKYKSQILYLFFGGITTIINIGTYYVLYNMVGIGNIAATVTALIFCVLVAFITSKVWVFNSRSFYKKTILYETLTFFVCRFLTGILDVGIMYLTVDILKFNGILMKIISNVVVVVLNYIASKAIIFNPREQDGR